MGIMLDGSELAIELDTILTHLEQADLIFTHARPYIAIVERDRVSVVVAIGNRALHRRPIVLGQL